MHDAHFDAFFSADELNPKVFKKCCQSLIKAMDKIIYPNQHLFTSNSDAFDAYERIHASLTNAKDADTLIQDLRDVYHLFDKLDIL